MHLNDDPTGKASEIERLLHLAIQCLAECKLTEAAQYFAKSAALLPPGLPAGEFITGLHSLAKALAAYFDDRNDLALESIADACARFERAGQTEQFAFGRALQALLGALKADDDDEPVEALNLLRAARKLVDAVTFASSDLADACAFWWDWTSMLVHGSCLIEQIDDFEPEEAQELVSTIGSHVTSLIGRTREPNDKALFEALGHTYDSLFTVGRAAAAFNDRAHHTAVVHFRAARHTLRSTHARIASLSFPPKIAQLLESFRYMEGLAHFRQCVAVAEFWIYRGNRNRAILAARLGVAVVLRLKQRITPATQGGVGFEVDVDDDLATAQSYLSQVSRGDPGLLALRPSLAKIVDPKVLPHVLSQVRELTTAFMSRLWLSTLALAGGLLESLLLAHLTRIEPMALASKQAPKRDGAPKPLVDWVLSDYIRVAKDLGILPADSLHLSDALREFRNLLHPGKGLREMREPTAREAVAACAALHVVIHHLAKP